jgi:hypothetical protein
MNNRNRVESFIVKLSEQFEQNASSSLLLITAKMLMEELLQQSGSSQMYHGDAVVMIAPHAALSLEKSVQEELVLKGSTIEATITSKEKKSSVFDLPVAEIADIPFLRSKPLPVEKKAVNFSETTKFENQPFTEDLNERKTQPAILNTNQDELHDSYKQVQYTELNEKLKAGKAELGEQHIKIPLADLKSGIGINERFLFIKELFNEDETMYERCIKTINGFESLVEAETWIQRELKVKIGWKEDAASTILFDQLIKRRFS